MAFWSIEKYNLAKTLFDLDQIFYGFCAFVVFAEFVTKCVLCECEIIKERVEVLHVIMFFTSSSDLLTGPSLWRFIMLGSDYAHSSCSPQRAVSL